MIDSLATAMKPSGTLVLDYLNVGYSEAHSAPVRKTKYGGINFSVVKWNTSSHFHKQIVIEDPLREYPLIFEEKVSKFRLQDFALFFRMHKLRIDAVFGDYDMNSYHETTSPRLILMASKMN